MGGEKRLSDIIKFKIIKTPGQCYIKDASKSSYRDSVSNYIYNGESPVKTNKDKWWMIPSYPTKIEIKSPDKKVNTRYK